MGRPLSKKFIGNRNIGTTGTGDNYGIGGEGIASINWSNLGLFRGNHATNKPLVGLDLPAPTLPTGVQATWTVIFEVASVSTGAGKAGLVVGDTYTFAAAGSPTITVNSTSGANATFTTTAGSGVAYGSLPTDTTGVNITKVTGSGPATFLTDINFKVKSAVINEKGSGYTGAETFTVTTYSATTGAAPAGTIVRTTDSGSVGSSTNQENAIRITAWVPATGTAGNISGNGTSAVAGDIVRQTGNGKYIVRTAQGVGRVKLVAKATGSLLEGEANIIATDSVTPTAGTYYVTKISDRRCNIVAATGTQFTTGTDGINVSWTFNGTSGDKVLAEQPYLTEDVNVKIANA